jgi:hypothetical protein
LRKPREFTSEKGRVRRRKEGEEEKWLFSISWLIFLVIEGNKLLLSYLNLFVFSLNNWDFRIP